jgi:hypothetical protein
MRDEGEGQMKPGSPESPVGSRPARNAIALRFVNAGACGLSAFVLTVLGSKLLCGG